MMKKMNNEKPSEQQEKPEMRENLETQKTPSLPSGVESDEDESPIQQFINRQGLEGAKYLADGVYLGKRGYEILLFTHRYGEGIHWLGMDGAMINDFLAYVARV